MSTEADARDKGEPGMAQPPASGKKSFAELGPLWITALTGLIAALAAAGFFVGRASAPIDRFTPPVTHSATAAGASTAASTPDVLYSGKRDLAESYAADLDNPDWAVAAISSSPPGADFYLNSGGLTRYLGNWGILTTRGVDGYSACAGFTAFASSTVPISGLGVGTRLCARTSDGRTGLLTVRNVSGQEPNSVMSFDVTVWEK